VCDDAVIEMHTMVSSAYETLHTCRAQSAAPRHVIGPPTLSYSGGLAGHAVTLLPLLDQGSSSAAAVVSKLHRDVEFTKRICEFGSRPDNQPHSDMDDEMANLHTPRIINVRPTDGCWGNSHVAVNR
jgi:hypothetical protein